MTVAAALVWCPFPDQVSARDVARRLLQEKMIACANILGEMESVFVWNDELGGDKEVPVLFKTSADILDEMIARLGDLHPYDTPAILGWRCDAAHPATLAWIGDLKLGLEKS